jgi:hypothetical protein
MAELVNAYINFQLCEMGDIPLKGSIDRLYPIKPLPRACLLLLPLALLLFTLFSVC